MRSDAHRPPDSTVHPPVAHAAPLQHRGVILTEIVVHLPASAPAGGEAEFALLQQIFQQANHPIAVVSGPEHRYEMANPAYLALLAEPDVLGKTAAENAPGGNAQQFIAKLEEARTHCERQVRWELPSWGGSTGPGPGLVHEFSLQPLRDAAGTVTRILIEAVDATERVRAQQRLSDQQEMIRLAMLGGRMGAWARDLSSNRVEWTPDLEALFGMDEGAFGGSEAAFLELIHPEDRAAVEAAVAHALRSQSDYSVEFRFRHASGEWRWMEGRGRGVHDERGAPLRLHGIGIDITDRKRSELRLSQLIEAAPVGVAISDPDGSILRANDALLSIFGYTRAEYELVRPDWRQLTPPEYLHLDLHHMDELRRGRAPPPFEKEFVRRDGSRAAVLICARFLPGEGERMVAFALDVTDHRRAEAELRRTELRLSRLFETNLLGVLFFDLNGTVQDANDEFLRIVGFNREDLANGRVDWSRMTPAEFQDQDARAVADLRAIGSHTPIEKQYVRKDGTRVWVLVGSAVIEGINGVGFVLDLSGLKAATAALQEADRRKDEFLATLAHELRNPLAPIRSAVQLMRLVPEADPRLQHAGQIIERQIRHMVRLVDDLLDVSRITLGQIQLQLEDVVLQSILVEAIESVRPSLEQAGHTLTLDLPVQDIVLHADGTRLSQVFQNLLNNSIKYTPAGGRIGLRARQERDSVGIEVSDTGLGIPLEV